MLTQSEVKNDLADLITDAMYMDAGDIQDEQLFSDFGLESVTLAKIVEKVCTKYSCSIEIKELLPHQTLNDASAFIYSKLA